MRKNLAVIALFLFLCFSLFLNLAAWGERIRLNGMIGEFNQSETHYYKYINAQAEVNNSLLNYCNNQKEVNVATLKNENSRLLTAVAKMPDIIAKVDEAASKAAEVRQERLGFMNNAKYVTKISLPGISIE